MMIGVRFASVAVAGGGKPCGSCGGVMLENFHCECGRGSWRHGAQSHPMHIAFDPSDVCIATKGCDRRARMS